MAIEKVKGSLYQKVDGDVKQLLPETSDDQVAVSSYKGEDTYKLHEVLTDLEESITAASGDTVVAKDITVTGVTVGNLSDGTVITKGKTLTQVLEQLLMKRIAASYTQPSLSLAASGTSFEVGETPNVTFTPTWRQNDAGTITGYTLSFDGAQVVNEATTQAYTANSVNMLANKSAQATVTFAEGAIKKDNMGDDSPNGHIMAGNKTATVNLSVYRNLFTGFSTASPAKPEDSDTIRALATKVKSPANGTTFNLVTPTGTQMACIAYPATIRDITSIKYVEASNMEVKDTFTKTTVSVAGANGASPIDYKVYTYVPAIPTVGTMTYNVTI